MARRYSRVTEAAAKLREELETLGGSIGTARSARAPSARPENQTNLVDALKAVLEGKTLSVSEAAQKVIEAGYQATSASFRQFVNQTLANSHRYERVECGRYTVRSR